MGKMDLEMSLLVHGELNVMIQRVDLNHLDKLVETGMHKTNMFLLVGLTKYLFTGTQDLQLM